MKFIKKSFLLGLVLVLFPFFSLSGESEPLTSTFKPQPHNNNKTVRKLASAGNQKVSLAVVFDPETKKAKCVQEVANSPHFVPRHMEVAKTPSTSVLLDLLPRCDKTTQAWLAQNSPKMVKRDPEEVAALGAGARIAREIVPLVGCVGSFHFGGTLAGEGPASGGGLATGAGATVVSGLFFDPGDGQLKVSDSYKKNIKDLQEEIAKDQARLTDTTDTNKIKGQIETNQARIKEINNQFNSQLGEKVPDTKALQSEINSLYKENNRLNKELAGVNSDSKEVIQRRIEFNQKDLNTKMKAMSGFEDRQYNKTKRQMSNLKQAGVVMAVCTLVGMGVAYFTDWY